MYEPESDSEDELPPGWEERATLQVRKMKAVGD